MPRPAAASARPFLLSKLFHHRPVESHLLEGVLLELGGADTVKGPSHAMVSRPHRQRLPQARELASRAWCSQRLARAYRSGFLAGRPLRASIANCDSWPATTAFSERPGALSVPHACGSRRARRLHHRHGWQTMALPLLVRRMQASLSGLPPSLGLRPFACAHLPRVR